MKKIEFERKMFQKRLDRLIVEKLETVQSNNDNKTMYSIFKCLLFILGVGKFVITRLRIFSKISSHWN